MSIHLREDIKSLFNGKFYITLLTLPSIGVISDEHYTDHFMSCVAFTNYDMDHMPPNYRLFTWVDLETSRICLQAAPQSHSPMHS